MATLSLTARTAPSRPALVELAARAAMHRDHPHARRLGAARELRRIERAVVPAEPHLQRHRHRDRADRRLDQGQRMVEIAHQRRAGLAAGHCWAGQPMLMSMMSAPARFGDARALRHPVRLAAGELDDVDADALAFDPQRCVVAPSARSPLAVISETTRPAPSRAARRRNGASVMPDIGREKHPVRQRERADASGAMAKCRGLRASPSVLHTN